MRKMTKRVLLIIVAVLLAAVLVGAVVSVASAQDEGPGHPWCELPLPERPFWCEPEEEPMPTSSTRSPDPIYLPLVFGG